MLLFVIVNREVINFLFLISESLATWYVFQALVTPDSRLPFVVSAPPSHSLLLLHRLQQKSQAVGRRDRVRVIGPKSPLQSL